MSAQASLCLSSPYNIRIQNKLFCCENIGIDHTLQTVQNEKLDSPKLFKKESMVTIQENLATHHLSSFEFYRVKVHSFIHSFKV